jgi:hypothetical protein
MQDSPDERLTWKGIYSPPACADMFAVDPGVRSEVSPKG